MAAFRKSVSLGPYARKQKLYLETDDGVAMEGEFVKFNASQTTILLHNVELIPSDGRNFDQYLAIISELVCLQSLEPVKQDIKVNTANEVHKPGDSEKSDGDQNGAGDFNLPEVDNSEETKQKKAENFASKMTSLRQRLIAAGFGKGDEKSNEPSAAVADSTKNEINIVEATSKGILKEGKESLNSSSNIKDDDRQNQRDQSKVKEEKEDIGQPKVVSGIYEGLKAKAKGYIIIDKPGPLLRSAFEDIEKRSILGLGSHGSEKGRLDRLSLLTVATESAIYLFDIHALGKQALQVPLVKALENASVQKVTYDCRRLSDCLYYVHHIRLTNVYDVQASDCVMYRCRKGSFINRGRSLQELVSQYLDLPAALLANNLNITSYKTWYQRPLQEGCFDFASWQVVFLLPLRSAIDKAFQNLMQNGSDVYLNHIRKMKRGEAVETMTHRSHHIPVDLLDAPFCMDS